MLAKNLCVSIWFILVLCAPSLAQAETHTVVVRRGSFEPEHLQIQAGDTVVWSFSDRRARGENLVSGTECSADGYFLFERSGPWVFEFAEKGTFAYFSSTWCEQGKTGVILVDSLQPVLDETWGAIKARFRAEEG